MFFFCLVVLLVILFYCLVTKNYKYWESRNVPHDKPIFLFGNYKDIVLRKRNYGEIVQGLCQKYENEKYIGAYFTTEPVLIPLDPDIIKLIMTKEFCYFNGRDLSDHSHKEPVALNLFSTHGDKWKVIRQNLTPLFSSAKMKNMFHLIEKCSHGFESMLDREVSISEEQNIRSLVSKFTIECIVVCAFGVDANTTGTDLDENPFKKLAAIFESTPTIAFYIRLLRSAWPSIYYFFMFKSLTKQLDIFLNLITSIMEKRDFKPSGRHDFVDLITSWKQNKVIVGDGIKSLKGGSEKVTLEVNNDMLVAQCVIFFAAGFETSATTVSYTLYELAKHEDMQNKVLEEVDEYLERHKNKLEYECINEMPYLDACIDEALRLYPVLGMISREVMEEYELPGGVKVTKGVRVHLPVYYLHHNPKYYQDPEEFRPERFLGEAKKNINPYTYMPFGEGPRMCIGMRFAKMQMMAGLITLLKKYRLELAADMPEKVVFIAQSMVTQPTTPIRLKFIERDGWQKKILA